MINSAVLSVVILSLSHILFVHAECENGRRYKGDYKREYQVDINACQSSCVTDPGCSAITWQTGRTWDKNRPMCYKYAAGSAFSSNGEYGWTSCWWFSQAVNNPNPGVYSISASGFYAPGG